jgi:Kef-type K+ transport system membrane component KefB
MATVVFSFVDARSDVTSIDDKAGNRIFDCVVLNPVIAGTLFIPLFYFTAAGAQDAPAYVATVTRDWIQIAVMYAGVFVLTKWISSLLLGWTQREGGTNQHGARTFGQS